MNTLKEIKDHFYLSLINSYYSNITISTFEEIDIIINLFCRCNSQYYQKGECTKFNEVKYDEENKFCNYSVWEIMYNPTLNNFYQEMYQNIQNLDQPPATLITNHVEDFEIQKNSGDCRFNILLYTFQLDGETINVLEFHFTSRNRSKLRFIAQKQIKQMCIDLHDDYKKFCSQYVNSYLSREPLLLIINEKLYDNKIAKGLNNHYWMRSMFEYIWTDENCELNPNLDTSIYSITYDGDML